MRILHLTNSGESTPLNLLETSEVVHLTYEDLLNPQLRLWYACVIWDKAFVEIGEFDLPEEFEIYLYKCVDYELTGTGVVSPSAIAALCRAVPSKAGTLRRAMLLKKDVRAYINGKESA